MIERPKGVTRQGWRTFYAWKSTAGWIEPDPDDEVTFMRQVAEDVEMDVVGPAQPRRNPRTLRGKIQR